MKNREAILKVDDELAAELRQKFMNAATDYMASAVQAGVPNDMTFSTVITELLGGAATVAGMVQATKPEFMELAEQIAETLIEKSGSRTKELVEKALAGGFNTIGDYLEAHPEEA